MNNFGLDIGSDSIKVVQVTREKNQFRLVTAGLAKTPEFSLSSEAEKDWIVLGEAIKRLKKESKINTNEVVVSLPERSVFTQIIEVPKMTTEELDQAIPWEAENLIPQPLSEVNLDWEVLEEIKTNEGEKMKILLVAAPSSLVNKYLRIIKLADLEAVALETETLATVRALKPVFSDGNLLVMNCGMKSSDISVIKNGQLFLNCSVPFAGEAITRAISNTLALDITVAEEYKRNYGLSTALEGKVGKAAEPVLIGIINEIKKAIHFFEEKNQNQIKLLILTGGGALLNGMTDYLIKNLGLEVQIADPFSLVGSSKLPNESDFRKNSPLFAVSLGLAMREI